VILEKLPSGEENTISGSSVGDEDPVRVQADPANSKRFVERDGVGDCGAFLLGDDRIDLTEIREMAEKTRKALGKEAVIIGKQDSGASGHFR
jgi:hypothetical protein